MGHEALLARLESFTVMTSRNLSRRLSVFQYAREHVVELQTGSIHLSTEADQLKLFLPRKGSERDLCLRKDVPKSIMRYLGISDRGAEAILIHIITIPSLRSIAAILEDEGIVEVDGLQISTQVEDDDDSDTESMLSTTLNSALVITPASTPRPSFGSRLNVAPPTLTPPQSSSHPNPSASAEPATPTGVRTVHSQSPERFHSAPTRVPLDVHSDARPSSPLGVVTPVIPAPTPFDSSIEPRTNTQGYGAILDRILRAALEDGLPAPGQMLMYGTGAYALELGTTFESLFPARTMDRDRKVGAAGELFVGSSIPLAHNHM